MASVVFQLYQSKPSQLKLARLASGRINKDKTAKQNSYAII